MADDPQDKAAFTLVDIKALRYLALSLGAFVCGVSLVSKSLEAQLLAVGLAAAIMLVGPLAIYFLRKHKSGRKRDG